MGTDDPAERALLQGLIKLAAAYVHDVRGNPAGIRKNLDGARARLVEGSGDARATPDGRTSTSTGSSPTSMRRLADLDDHPDRPDPPATDPAQESHR